MVYLPGVILRRTYSPALFETDECSTEVSTLCNKMLAPGMTAPAWSRTTPFTEAVETCPLTVLERTSKIRPSRTAKCVPETNIPICRARPCA
jgi:hypothetical protein